MSFSGGDFIKTSTGKEAVNAILLVGLVMVRAIREYNQRTGVKVSYICRIFQKLPLSYLMAIHLPYSFVYTCVLKLTRTPHKTLAEVGIFCVIFALCSQLVVPNAEITWIFPSPACLTVDMCLYCIIERQQV